MKPFFSLQYILENKKLQSYIYLIYLGINLETNKNQMVKVTLYKRKIK